MSDEEDTVIEVDEFGFDVVPDKQSSNDLVDYIDDDSLSFNKKKSTYNTILWVLFFIWLSMAIIAGYHAYHVYPTSSSWVTGVRVYVAALFAPFYLFFIFLKSLIFG